MQKSAVRETAERAVVRVWLGFSLYVEALGEDILLGTSAYRISCSNHAPTDVSSSVLPPRRDTCQPEVFTQDTCPDSSTNILRYTVYFRQLGEEVVRFVHSKTTHAHPRRPWRCRRPP